MKINADFSRRVAIDTSQLEWTDSPMQGVQRKMLDRLGAESGRATSLVRYAPGSYFSAHTHVGGEEFLVLEGTFSDEHGDYPTGTYVRNPIASKHTPFSKDGCTIFVKLCQFHPEDNTQFSLNTHAAEWSEKQQGLEVLNLHHYGTEQVMLVRLEPNKTFRQRGRSAGQEMLLLDGRLENEFGIYEKGMWIRQPAGESRVCTTPSGALFYLKTGHLGKNI